MSEPSEIMTAKEAADFLRIEIKLLYKLIESGEIQARRVGSRYRVSKDVLVAYIKGESNHE